MTIQDENRLMDLISQDCENMNIIIKVMERQLELTEKIIKRIEKLEKKI